RGELFQPTDYNTQTVLKAKITPRTTLTFYTRFGDLIARWAALICGLYFLIAISGRLKPKDAG
ncbi:MAG: apolipoprotein N-acyltransferase, partial [Flavobacteriaceae bacterium]